MKRLILAVSFLFVFMWSGLVLPGTNPTPAPLNDPLYNYSTPNSCTVCHFLLGAKGDHMPEAVGVKFNDATQAFVLTGGGWFASHHSRTNHRSTQNTFCAKCHSPLEATPQATFEDGFLMNTALVADGKIEGVTCNACHPPHGTNPRLGIYKYGQPTNQATSYQLIKEDEQDLLCLNCHIERHNENNPAFKRMYDAGVQCTDCHMARYGKVAGGTVIKRAHDFKVAQNLPYSCGVRGSLPGFTCHSEFSANATLAFLPYLKEQHKEWWPLDPSAAGKTAGIQLQSSHDYYEFWRYLEQNNGGGDIPAPTPATKLFGGQ